MPSAVDQRRLGDGARAKARGEELPDKLNDLISLRDELHSAICALQSLDDLGSEQANQAAWDDMTLLQKRYDKVVARIKNLKP